MTEFYDHNNLLITRGVTRLVTG